jgi:hypothetical protein
MQSSKITRGGRRSTGGLTRRATQHYSSNIPKLSRRLSWNRTKERAEMLATRIAGEGVAAEAVGDLDTATREADDEAARRARLRRPPRIRLRRRRRHPAADRRRRDQRERCAWRSLRPRHRQGRRPAVGSRHHLLQECRRRPSRSDDLRDGVSAAGQGAAVTAIGLETPRRPP